MQHYYIVPRVGTGTDDDPYRPDVPDGTSWVGLANGVNHSYLIAAADTIDGLTELTETNVREQCAARGLLVNDVLNVWRVSDDPPATGP